MSITMIFSFRPSWSMNIVLPSSWAFVQFLGVSKKNIHRLRNGTGSDVCNDDLSSVATYLIYYPAAVLHQQSL